MSQSKKLKARLLLCPADFSWQELQKLLGALGYTEYQAGKTSGSRGKYFHENFEPMMLHKPHPKPVLKRYQIRQIIDTLKERGQL